MPRNHALHDMTGKVFGRLTVIGRSGSDKQRSALWNCRCECGTEKVILGRSLRKGATMSCGCYSREHRRTSHGCAARVGRAPEYIVWAGIKDRCENRKNPNYRHYGGRGISICDRWSSSFESFLADMGRKPFPGATVERRDNSIGYSAENCYWATMKQQSRNKRTNVAVIRSDGARFGTIVEAAESVGVHSTGVRAACLGKQNTAGGYGWKFAALTALIAKDSSNG